eukprot:6384727-Pyramimonas_sp.AAC.1
MPKAGERLREVEGDHAGLPVTLRPCPRRRRAATKRADRSCMAVHVHDVLDKVAAPHKALLHWRRRIQGEAADVVVDHAINRFVRRQLQTKRTRVLRRPPH